MRNPLRHPWHCMLLGFLLFALAGCAAGNSGRHLSSDVCLLLPEQTTKQDVIRQLGSPDVKTHNAEGETWYYYQVHRSTLRGLPLIGKIIGSEEYELVSITFDAAQVRACVFRALDTEEFRSMGIVTEQPDE